MSHCGGHYSNTAVEPLAKSPVCAVGRLRGDPGCGAFRGLNSHGSWAACAVGGLVLGSGLVEGMAPQETCWSTWEASPARWTMTRLALLRPRAGLSQVTASWVDRFYPVACKLCIGHLEAGCALGPAGTSRQETQQQSRVIPAAARPWSPGPVVLAQPRGQR